MSTTVIASEVGNIIVKTLQNKFILGIETSCDETSAAVLSFSDQVTEEKNDKVKGKNPLKNINTNHSITPSLRHSYTLLSHVISSQVKLHAKFGGVVPMLAAREQQKNIEPVITQALQDAEHSLQDIDYFAVTRGPGLIPSLHVGVNYARAISFAMQKPLLGINHLEGHVYSNWLPPIAVNSKFQKPNSKQQSRDLQSISYKLKTISFPILNLIVSGGHTELVLMTGHGRYKMIGETMDDAAGEAFDKVARMLDLPYPGGPSLARIAEKGDPKAFAFPRPMLSAKNFDFSFSGLKTAVLYKIQELSGQVTEEKSDKVNGKSILKNNRTDHSVTPSLRHLIPDLAASFQQAAVDVLVEKTIRAAKKFKAKSVFVSGGVSANSTLRATLTARIDAEFPHMECRFPNLAFTGDNAAMIAMAAYWKLQVKSHKVIKSKKHIRPGVAHKPRRFSDVVADANLRIA